MAQITVHELGRTAQCPAVDVAGDALHVLGVFVAPWRCHLEQDRQLSCTIRWPGEVAASTSRRHLPPCWNANCCANAPPHDKPSTSTCTCPNWSSSCALSRAKLEGRYGSQGDGDPPTPGTSKMIASGP